MGEAIYVDIPGVSTHELPPLLVRGVPEGILPREQVVELATEIVDSEDMLSDDLSAESAEECKLNLAIHLTDQYFRLLSHWQWGDSILEWIRQCEITFESQDLLRGLLKKDLWPHCGTQQLCGSAGGKIDSAKTRFRVGKGGRDALDVPPAATHRLLLQPVFVLSQLTPRGIGLSNVVAHERRGIGALSAQPVSF